MKAARARLNAMPWRKVAAPEFLPGEDIGCDDAALLDLEAREARAQGSRARRRWRVCSARCLRETASVSLQEIDGETFSKN